MSEGAAPDKVYGPSRPGTIALPVRAGGPR
jgi:hypothetical protein